MGKPLVNNNIPVDKIKEVLSEYRDEVDDAIVYMKNNFHAIRRPDYKTQQTITQYIEPDVKAVVTPIEYDEEY